MRSENPPDPRGLELIGLAAKVIDAKNGANIGLSGTIIDETKNTIMLRTSHGQKTLIKSCVCLEVRHEDAVYIIEGKAITGRHHERSVIR